VDWEARAATLASMRDAFAKDRAASLVADLARTGWDGGIKLLVAWRLLELRRRLPALFSEGAYQPLESVGQRAPQVCAFARVLGSDAVVVATPRLCGSLPRGDGLFPLSDTSWGDTALRLPELETGGDAVEAVTGRPVTVHTSAGRPAVRLADLFAELPVAAVRVSIRASSGASTRSGAAPS
jgi:(1->4)-alpha-D-glucan 1-alpha-D-glucosylmutase